MERKVYAEIPPRAEYTLTELGLSLKPILDSMWKWGKGYKVKIDEEYPPLNGGYSYGKYTT